MEGKIEYRPMRESDLPQLARILGVTWHEDSTGKLQELIGLADLANMAGRNTYSQVAVMRNSPHADNPASESSGETVLGVVLARAGSANEDTQAHWRAVLKDALAQASEIDEQYAKGYEQYMQAEHASYERLLENSTCDGNFELVLFIVSPHARGRGVGGQLMSRAKEYLAGAGAKTAFLFTDTTCTWEYYEHRGMRRAGEWVNNENRILPDRMFVYEFSLDN